MQVSKRAAGVAVGILAIVAVGVVGAYFLLAIPDRPQGGSVMDSGNSVPPVGPDLSCNWVWTDGNLASFFAGSGMNGSSWPSAYVFANLSFMTSPQAPDPRFRLPWEFQTTKFVKIINCSFADANSSTALRLSGASNVCVQNCSFNSFNVAVDISSHSFAIQINSSRVAFSRVGVQIASSDNCSFSCVTFTSVNESFVANKANGGMIVNSSFLACNIGIKATNLAAFNVTRNCFECSGMSVSSAPNCQGNSYWLNNFTGAGIVADEKSLGDAWSVGGLGNFYTDYLLRNPGAILQEDSRLAGYSVPLLCAAFVGSVPYVISPTGARDMFPLAVAWNAVPHLLVQSPSNGSVFGRFPPACTILASGPLVDNIWYEIAGISGIFNVDNSVPLRWNYSSSYTFCIDGGAWASLGSGLVNVTFHVGNFFGSNYSVIWPLEVDITAPTLQVLSPLPGDSFGPEPPSFSLVASDPHLARVVYTLGDALTEYDAPANGTVDLALWNALPLGGVRLAFTAADTLNNSVTVVVWVNKVPPLPPGPPSVLIIYPRTGDLAGNLPPYYSLNITSSDSISCIWYSLDGGKTIHFLANPIGYLDEEIWNASCHAASGAGTITITFYVNDTAGRVGFAQIPIKIAMPGESSVFDVFLLLKATDWLLLLVAILLCVLVGVEIKRARKSRAKSRVVVKLGGLAWSPAPVSAVRGSMPPSRSQSWHKVLAGIFIGAVVLGAFAGISWYLVSRQQSPAAATPTPPVPASAAPGLITISVSDNFSIEFVNSSDSSIDFFNNSLPALDFGFMAVLYSNETYAAIMNNSASDLINLKYGGEAVLGTSIFIAGIASGFTSVLGGLDSRAGVAPSVNGKTLNVEVPGGFVVAMAALVATADLENYTWGSVNHYAGVTVPVFAVSSDLSVSQILQNLPSRFVCSGNSISIRLISLKFDIGDSNWQRSSQWKMLGVTVDMNGVVSQYSVPGGI